MLSIDHFVVGALDLERGTAWMADRIGQMPSGGGKHPQMGTHNKLWRLGQCYMEVIAIDPEAEKPDHPRWFGLDELPVQDRLFEQPHLLTWVVRSKTLREDMARSPHNPGEMMQLKRDNLHWQISVPADGIPLKNGAFPSFIDWPEEVRTPVQSIPDSGLRVEKFTISGAPGLHKDLKILGATDLYERHTDNAPPSMSLILRSVESFETFSLD